jgi:hypothetical protein
MLEAPRSMTTSAVTSQLPLFSIIKVKGMKLTISNHNTKGNHQLEKADETTSNFGGCDLGTLVIEMSKCH